MTITATNGAGTSEPSVEVSGRTHEAGMIVYFNSCQHIKMACDA